MPKYTGHEKVLDSKEIKVGSEKSFGLVFCIVFLIVSGYSYFKGAQTAYVWALPVAGIFLFLGLVCPKVLKTLNVAWFYFGLLLSKIMNPLIMGIMFYGLITPMGLVMRAFGRKPLVLGFDKNAQTYWQESEKKEDPAASLKNQF